MDDISLYIVPTPIGNMSDITRRAIGVLGDVDFILAEDTRTSGILMKQYDISSPMMAYHQHNEHKVLEKVIERLKAGEQAALVSDAGTPGISDPAFLIIRECIRENLRVSCLPGPVAFIPALVCSGLPCERFSPPISRAIFIRSAISLTISASIESIFFLKSSKLILSPWESVRLSWPGHI